jgi:hypothetical protein
MGCFSKWDIGGCGCESDCSCYPCTLPEENLLLAAVYGESTGTATAVYQGGSSCEWIAHLTSPVDIYLYLGCTGGCSYFYGFSGSMGWNYPVGCGGKSGVYLASYTCSPLSVKFSSAPGGGGNTWTFTAPDGARSPKGRTSPGIEWLPGPCAGC